jgi:hypothetical protein
VWWFTLLPIGAIILHCRKEWFPRNIVIGIFAASALFASIPVGYHGYPRSSSCGNRLKQLALAIHNNHTEYRQMPSQCLSAANGKPGLSWRVQLLPFVEQIGIYTRFDLHQAWDGPANRPLADVQFDLYRCPAETNQRHTETSYVAIAGDDTCWPAGGPIRFNDIADGTSNALLFGETHDSGILWPEPRDLQYDQLDWRLQGSPGKSLSSSHGPVIEYFDGSRKLKSRTSVNVALADGSVLHLSRDVDPEVLRQLANRHDGGPKQLPD